jgi:hypothetical protein
MLRSVRHLGPFRDKLAQLQRMLKTHSSRRSEFSFDLDRSQDTLGLAGDGGMSFFDQIITQLPLAQVQRLRRRGASEEGEELWSITLKNERGVDAGGVAREILAKVSAELMLPQLGLFTLTPNGRLKVGKHHHFLVPVLTGQNERLSYAGALMARAFVANEPQR